MFVLHQSQKVQPMNEWHAALTMVPFLKAKGSELTCFGAVTMGLQER